MTVTSKRAEYVSVVAMVLCAIFFGLTFFVGRWSGYFVVGAAAWLIASAAAVWFALWLQFHTQTLAEQEKLDTAQLARERDDSTIFDSTGGRAEVFAVAQRRLELFERWFLPIFACFISAFQIAIGMYLFLSFSAELVSEATRPLVCAICMAGAAFFSFLVSRYATGMSSQLQWRPLRAGGSGLLVIAIVCFALTIGLALAHFKIFLVVTVISYAVPVVMIVLGAETALNVIFDIYRPRLKGQYSKSAFDSRLLGIINEPGGLFHSLAAAIDYQFGFKVSQTWFYKLLERAIVPLVLFGVVVVYLLSCVVIVGPSEQAVVEYLGNPLTTAGQVRLLGPGLSFKLPWPFGIAYKHPTGRIMELSIGYVPKINPKTGQPLREPLLWGKSHYQEEYNVLVASEQTGRDFDEAAVPITLLTASVPVQYRIKDLYSFIYNHKEPQRHLEAICYRQLAKFAASATVEVNSAAELENSLLGAGRAKAKELLTARIQAASDRAGLGVEIVFVGMQGIHPPPEVAEDYQKVVGAIQEKQALILHAEATRNGILGVLAGSVQDADRLSALAAEFKRAEQQNDTERLNKLAQELDAAFAQAGGDIFGTLADAKGYAFEKAALAQADGKRFAGQLKAYRSAKDIFKRQARLAVLEEALENTRKFIIVADTDDTQVFIVDVQEKLTPSLYDVTGFEESGQK